MKIEHNIISIQIDHSEWDKIETEFNELRYGESKKKFDYKNFPYLFEFLDRIKTCKQNPSHTVNDKLNKFIK